MRRWRGQRSAGRWANSGGGIRTPRPSGYEVFPTAVFGLFRACREGLSCLGLRALSLKLVPDLVPAPQGWLSLQTSRFGARCGAPLSGAEPRVETLSQATSFEGRFQLVSPRRCPRHFRVKGNRDISTRSDRRRRWREIGKALRMRWSWTATERAPSLSAAEGRSSRSPNPATVDSTRCLFMQLRAVHADDAKQMKLDQGLPAPDRRKKGNLLFRRNRSAFRSTCIGSTLGAWPTTSESAQSIAGAGVCSASRRS